jgi:hypothetical protein
MFSMLIVWFLTVVFVFCDDGDKFRISIRDRVESIKSVKNYFRSGCMFFVESLDEDLQGK